MSQAADDACLEEKHCFSDSYKSFVSHRFSSVNQSTSVLNAFTIAFVSHDL